MIKTRRYPLCKILILLGFSFVLFYLYSRISSDNVKSTSSKVVLPTTAKREIKRIVISFVVCDSRFNESLNVVKSALLFTKTPLHFVIFTEERLIWQFNGTLSDWSKQLGSYNRLNYELHKINFPAKHEEEWLNLFSKCAAQRLFIPKLIAHIDAMIYVDVDTLFLGPADELWSKFAEFNSSQISAMTLETENPLISWYPRFAKHPFYGKSGLNSGVMLMNLTRMRDFGWVDYVTPIMLKWKLYIPWGDQDIINVIFHYQPDAVRVLPCRFNYRSDACMYGDACHEARAGALLLHGSRRAFHGDKQPAFQAVYRAIDEFKIGADPRALPPAMEAYFTGAPVSPCGALRDAFLKLPLDTIAKLYNEPDR